MGTRNYPRLSKAEMVERYRAGEGMVAIGVRAKVSTEAVRQLLLSAGVRLRTPAEVRALVSAKRCPWKALL